MSLLDAELPIVAAPMAGGPSTVDLVAAAAAAGGFGFLPAGYREPAALASTLAEARARGIPFGVNVFVPSPEPMPVTEFRRYAELIAPEGIPYGLDLAAAEPVFEDDHWAAKIDLLCAEPVAVVSFTFGFPPAGVIAALKRAGSRIAITVTNESEARTAAELGADLLVVQGSAAGGHSGTAAPERTPAAITLTELVRRIRQVSALPLI
ncbi:MAG TPA: nitronate monooxygenase, partial [Mycobacteriales bacterium]|nr:nitronate monooxygenase [Mycobacteriales bacterium]